MEEVKAYKCGFCNKVYEKKSSAYSHQRDCYKNPKSGSCITCAHLILEETTIYNPIADEYYTDKFRVCEKDRESGVLHKLKTKCWNHSEVDNVN